MLLQLLAISSVELLLILGIIQLFFRKNVPFLLSIPLLSLCVVFNFSFLTLSLLNHDSQAEKGSEEIARNFEIAKSNEDKMKLLVSNQLDISPEALIWANYDDYYMVTGKNEFYQFYFNYNKEGNIIGIKESVKVKE